MPSASPISLQAQSIGISSSVWEQILTFANRWLLVNKGANFKINDKIALCWAYKQIVEETTPADVTGSSDVSDPDFLKQFEDMVKQFEDMVKDVSIPAWGATLPEVSAFAKSFTENAKTFAINNIPDSNTPIPGHTLFTCKDLRRLVASPDETEVELLTRLQDFLCIHTTSERRVHVLKGITTGMDTSRSMREVSITLPFQYDKYRGIFNIASLGSQSKHKKPNKTNFTHQVCIFLILSIYLCC